MDLQIEISIADYPSGGSFRLSDRVTVKDVDFKKMAAILGAYHDLTQSMKEDRPREERSS